MRKSVCIFGEVLFDHFPDGHKVLGGAPFNVAWHLQAFGMQPDFVSRVGDDEEGNSIRNAMQQWGMDTSHLQTDPALATGKVDVQIIGGEPEYDIVAPCAWDRIAPPEPLPACDMLYHGSLALRDEVSFNTARALLQQRPGMVFVDINLRPPWWHPETNAQILQHADWVKLNEHELDLLLPDNMDARAKCTTLMAMHKLRGIILTRGAAGAELLTGEEHYTVVPETDTVIADTVGAGDAFCAVILLGLLSEWPEQRMLSRAQQFASAIVGQRGATVSDPAFYRQLMDGWQPTSDD